MAGAAGFEPAITGSKPDALPLGYAPIENNYIYLYLKLHVILYITSPWLKVY